MSGDTPQVIDVPTPPTTAQTEAQTVVPIAALVSERKRAQQAAEALAAAQAELETLREQSTGWRTAAEEWQAYQTQQAEALRVRNAERIAALPEVLRTKAPETTDDRMVQSWLDAVELASQHAAQVQGAGQAPAPAPPAAGYPQGGMAPTATPDPNELTPAELRWVESERPDLRSISPSVVRKFYNLHGPGKATKR